jgi:hypothetical protein
MDTHRIVPLLLHPFPYHLRGAKKLKCGTQRDEEETGMTGEDKPNPPTTCPTSFSPSVVAFKNGGSEWKAGFNIRRTIKSDQKGKDG